MPAVVKRTNRQSGAVYTAFRVISYQMPPRERVDKLRRDKPNLPEGSLQQYKSLTDRPTNDKFLFGSYSRRQKHLIQDLRIIFNKKIPHLEKLKSLIGRIK